MGFRTHPGQFRNISSKRAGFVDSGIRTPVHPQKSQPTGGILVRIALIRALIRTPHPRVAELLDLTLSSFAGPSFAASSFGGTGPANPLGSGSGSSTWLMGGSPWRRQAILLPVCVCANLLRCHEGFAPSYCVSPTVPAESCAAPCVDMWWNL